MTYYADRDLHTSHVYPPIPIRTYDWCAYRDSYEPPDPDGVGGGLIGWGRTEAEAIEDLEAQEAEAEAEAEAAEGESV